MTSPDLERDDTPTLVDHFHPGPSASVELLREWTEVQLARVMIQRFEGAHVPPRLLEGLSPALRQHLEAPDDETAAPVSLEEARQLLEDSPLPAEALDVLTGDLETLHASSRRRAREVLSGRYGAGDVDDWFEAGRT